MTRARPRLRFLLLIAVVLLGAWSTLAQTSTSFSAKSPYRSGAKTKRLIDTLSSRVLLQLEYTEDRGSGGDWKTAKLPGAESGRHFRRLLEGGRLRTLEIAATPLAEGGSEIHVYGVERGLEGAAAEGLPNADVATVEAYLREMESNIQLQRSDPTVQPKVAYQALTLSYVQSDRALAILKALGFSTIEYSEQPGESAYQKIFAPLQNGEWKLPVVVKIIDSSKTSLMDPAALPRDQNMGGMAGMNEAAASLPDLGGLYLHSVTSGEPHQRLMVVYDPDEPETLESLMNLLREQIDVPARQILIEALVIELNANRLSDLGVSLGSKGIAGSSIAGTSKDYNGSIGYAAPEDLTDPAKVLADTFNPFTFVFNRTGLEDTFKFRASLSALVDKGDAEILSNPSVLVLDGRQARIQIGQNRPVVETTATNFATQSTVRYFPVGIVLNLRPRVAEDGSEIVMQVETIVSSVALSGSTEGVLFAPVIDNRQVQTFVRVSNDTPFIIGGLISTEKTNQMSGIPLLSEIPVFGALFRRTVRQVEKKEVIVVLTPHVVPQRSKNYSYVIPQETEIFDSFDHKLFRNAYRIREQDVFDLKFLAASQFFADLKDRISAAVDANRDFAEVPAVASVLDGGVPGEEVLVRRMLWEIVGRTDFSKSILLDRIIFFENAPSAADGTGFKLSFLGKSLRGLDREKNALFLTYGTDLAGTAEHPFVQPRAFVSIESLASENYVKALAGSNRRKADGEPDQWTAILSNQYAGITSEPLELLKRILVLKRILALNPSLPLTLKEFYPGRQIIFPTDEDLEQRYHLLDPEAARMFYEIALYYPAFEQEFMYQNRKILNLLQGGGQVSP